MPLFVVSQNCYVARFAVSDALLVDCYVLVAVLSAVAVGRLFFSLRKSGADFFSQFLLVSQSMVQYDAQIPRPTSTR